MIVDLLRSQGGAQDVAEGEPSQEFKVDKSFTNLEHPPLALYRWSSVFSTWYLQQIQERYQSQSKVHTTLAHKPWHIQKVDPLISIVLSCFRVYRMHPLKSCKHPGACIQVVAM